VSEAPPDKESRKKLAEAARKVDKHPRLVKAARLARGMLPGDERYGDPLSTAGEKPSNLAGRQLSELTAASPGVLRELGLGALQVWQALSEAQGRGRGAEEVAVLFTDLVGFSSWALEAGDEAALDLLRDVGEAIEPPLTERGGRIVKRLGDGLMAVFLEPSPAVEGVLEARQRLQPVRADGYSPRMRAGMHVGQPRKLGGDYLGVDVNIAARLAEAAGPDEILVSDRVVEALGDAGVQTRRKRWFKAKGAPKDLAAYAVDAQA
jgi:adenylate cyclase